MFGTLVLSYDVAVGVDDDDRIGERIHDRGQHLALLIEATSGETEFLNRGHASQNRAGEGSCVH